MKFIFTGPESSGKTSVSKIVAERLKLKWYPEFSRTYLLEKKGKYEFDDIEIIGQKQKELRAIEKKTEDCIMDTGPVVLYIWSIYKYQKCAQSIEEMMCDIEECYYFLCNPDGVIWEADPLREHPNKRQELFNLYQKQLEKLNAPYSILSGDREERIAQSINVILKKSQRKNPTN